MLLKERTIRQTAAPAPAPAVPATLPAPLAELLRTLIEREAAQRRYRPARVHLPGRTITGSALIQPDGWLSVYDDEINAELQTRLHRCQVALLKARQAVVVERDYVRGMESQEFQLQELLRQRETVVSESFPPAPGLRVEWLQDDDETATSADLFDYAEGH